MSNVPPVSILNAKPFEVAQNIMNGLREWIAGGKEPKSIISNSGSKLQEYSSTKSFSEKERNSKKDPIAIQR